MLESAPAADASEVRPLPLSRARTPFPPLLTALLKVVLSVLPQPVNPLLAGPRLHLRWRWGWLKGWAVRPWWRLLEALGGSRIRVGRRFVLKGKLRARGPGTVIIGDDVVVHSEITPFTHSPEAEIHIGDRAQLGGTRMGCFTRIEIGEDCMVADCRIFDTDFHSISARRCVDPTLPAISKPVKICRNVWVGAAAAILKGVTIGENSVVSFGAVVLRDMPANSVIGGNPARVFAPVPD